MIIPNDSILRRLPRGIDDRARFVLDGIRYSCDIVDVCHSRLARTLEAVAGGTDGHPPASDAYASAFGDAWTIVDAVARLRKLVIHVPRAKRRLEITSFVGGLQVVTDLRNSIQHIDTDHGRHARARWSTWGELNWHHVPDPESEAYEIRVLGSACMSHAAEQSRRYSFDPDAPLDRSQRVSAICLSAHGMYVNLSDLWNQVRAACCVLEELVSQMGEISPQFAGDPCFALLMRGRGPRAPNDAIGVGTTTSRSPVRRLLAVSIGVSTEANAGPGSPPVDAPPHDAGTEAAPEPDDPTG